MNTLRISADYESARRIGPWLREQLSTVGTTEPRVGELELAIHEVAINIVDHAFGGETLDQQFTISLAHGPEPGVVQAQLCDGGAPFSAAPTPDLDHPQIGGYGLFIAEQLANSVSYERVDGINVWTLTFVTTVQEGAVEIPQPSTQETPS